MGRANLGHLIGPRKGCQNQGSKGMRSVNRHFRHDNCLLPLHQSVSIGIVASIAAAIRNFSFLLISPYFHAVTRKYLCRLPPVLFPCIRRHQLSDSGRHSSPLLTKEARDRGGRGGHCAPADVAGPISQPHYRSVPPLYHDDTRC